MDDDEGQDGEREDDSNQWGSDEEDEADTTGEENENENCEQWESEDEASHIIKERTGQASQSREHVEGEKNSLVVDNGVNTLKVSHC